MFTRYATTTDPIRTPAWVRWGPRAVLALGLSAAVLALASIGIAHWEELPATSSYFPDPGRWEAWLWQVVATSCASLAGAQAGVAAFEADGYVTMWFALGSALISVFASVQEMNAIDGIWIAAMPGRHVLVAATVLATATAVAGGWLRWRQEQWW